MKIVKRILIALGIIILLIQIPFAYRRYKIGRLAEKIAQADAKRAAQNDPRYREYKGIIHAHTGLGGHSTGSFDELIGAANSNGLDFVLLTEHWSDAYNTSALTLNGVYGKTLFVGGNEIDTADGDRFLMIPGNADAPGMRKIPTNAVLEKLQSENRLALATYPEKFKSWDSNFDGIEVFSLHTNAKQMNPFTASFDIIWSYRSYPELLQASYLLRPDDNLKKFDEIAANRSISLFAGTDAHSNIGFHMFGDDAGNRLINVKLDAYQTTFGIVRSHVLIDKNVSLSPETLVEAIKRGRFYTGFDAIGDTSGFSFTASDGVNTRTMGESSPSSNPTFRIAAPTAGRFILFRNGEKVHEEKGLAVVKVASSGPGAYRVEVYRDDLGPPFDKMPWIMSNPIYVR